MKRITLFIMVMKIYWLKILSNEGLTIHALGDIKGGDILESILTSVKKLLGIAEEYEQFDTDIIMHINSVFMILRQLGVGPSEGFSINDKNSKWTDFLDDDITLESVKSYVYLKVRLLFDPPTSGVVMEATNRMINELEWRINACIDK